MALWTVLFSNRDVSISGNLLQGYLLFTEVKMNLSQVLCYFLILLVSLPATADVIHLKNGRKIQNILIVKRDGTAVYAITGDRKIKVLMADVLAIDESSRADISFVMPEVGDLAAFEELTVEGTKLEFDFSRYEVMHSNIVKAAVYAFMKREWEIVEIGAHFVNGRLADTDIVVQIDYQSFPMVKIFAVSSKSPVRQSYLENLQEEFVRRAISCAG